MDVRSSGDPAEARSQYSAKLWFLRLYRKKCNNIGGGELSCFLSRVLVLQNSDNSSLPTCAPEVEISVKARGSQSSVMEL